MGGQRVLGDQETRRYDGYIGRVSQNCMSANADLVLLYGCQRVTNALSGQQLNPLALCVRQKRRWAQIYNAWQ